MPKKMGIAIIVLGAALIFSALLLFLSNRRETQAAGQAAESMMSNLESWMQRQTEPATETSEDTTASSSEIEETEPIEPTVALEMPVVNIDGYDYVGYVEIPKIKIKLPVLAEWNERLLKIAPCRHRGSSRTDDLVLAAHNYTVHFGKLELLSAGDLVTFTDMDGLVNTYSVVKIETLAPTEVDSVLNSGFDLVLYTCTLSGKSRVTVFCNRVETSE